MANIVGMLQENISSLIIILGSCAGGLLGWLSGQLTNMLLGPKGQCYRDSLHKCSEKTKICVTLREITQQCILGDSEFAMRPVSGMTVSVTTTTVLAQPCGNAAWMNKLSCSSPCSGCKNVGCALMSAVTVINFGVERRELNCHQGLSAVRSVGLLEHAARTRPCWIL